MAREGAGLLPGKSIVPLLSASTSLIMSCNSDSLGFWPSERITVPSSFVVIWPREVIGRVSRCDCHCLALIRHTISIFILGPIISGRQVSVGKGLLTKREKASLNSETCSSVNESACTRNISVSVDSTVHSLARCGADVGLER